MKRGAYYENYPLRIICTSLLFTILSYLLGFIIFYSIDWILGIIYLLVCFISFFVVMKYRCSYCYYYNKRCFSSFGKLSGIFFKKGNPKEFSNPKNLMKAATFDFGLLFAAFFGSLYLVIFRFSILNLLFLIVFLLVSVAPNFFLRKNLFCKGCKQGKLGCPAYKKMQNKKD